MTQDTATQTSAEERQQALALLLASEDTDFLREANRLVVDRIHELRARKAKALRRVLTEGDSVRIANNVGPKWSGLEGIVVKVNRTKAHVRTAHGTVNVPIGCLEPVLTANATQEV